LIDPPSDVERAILERDAIRFAVAEKFDGLLADQRHIPQVQNPLLPRCLDGEQLVKLVDFLCCFDPAADGEQNLTIPCSPSSQHASSPCSKTADAANDVSFFWALLNQTRIEEKQLGGQR
jgi:hypothetical protein